MVLSTRSGTNVWHGVVSEYFRNDVLDANDWFANQGSQPRAPERDITTLVAFSEDRL